jgi:uncharacterized membrane protein
MNNKSQTTLGLDENIEGVLCYVLGWITGLVFLLLEKESRFVRFHAMQSLLFSLSIMVVMVVVNIVIGVLQLPILALIPTGLSVGILFLWILLLYKAFQGERYKLPIVGEIAAKQLKN